MVILFSKPSDYEKMENIWASGKASLEIIIQGEFLINMPWKLMLLRL